jgi:predicted lipid carrier protein YhbT
MQQPMQTGTSPDRMRPLPPPFSALLMIGLLLRPLPAGSLQPIASLAMRTMVRRHPGVFRRLRSLGNVAISVDPVDLPFIFHLRPGASAPTLSVLDRRRDLPQTVARISGPMAALLTLLEGREDGDSLFFSRVLAVEGDVEVVLALRNAIDGENVDLLSDLTSPFGFAAQAVQRAVRLPMAAAVALARDATLLQSALLAPLSSRLRQQDGALQRMHDRLEATIQEVRRMKPSLKAR